MFPETTTSLQESPFSSGTVTVPQFVSPTGFDDIDGLLDRWQWAESEITFSFPDSFSLDYAADYARYNSHFASFGQATDNLQTVVKQWLSSIADVSGLTFIEFDGPDNSDTADANALLRVAMSNNPLTAYAYTPDDSDEAADVWFNKDTYGAWFDQAQIGEYAWHTIGHEILHALGLKHGHEGGGVSNVALPLTQDSMEFTIMTYRSYENQVVTGAYANAYGNYAQTLMMLDIQALQTLYGANYNTYEGDTQYSFSSTTGELLINGESQGQPVRNTVFRTIWDGNGTDTYNLSNYNTSLKIDLKPGGYVDLDQDGNRQRALLGQAEQIYARGHVFNSLLFEDDSRSLIENAIGGSGSDEIQGNRTDNRLDGGDGDDTIAGADGADILLDGAGEDVLTGGAASDRFILEADGDRDRITDFTVGIDELDLSAWEITDLSQLQLTVNPSMLELTFGQESLELDNVDADTFDVTTIIGVTGQVTTTDAASDPSVESNDDTSANSDTTDSTPTDSDNPGTNDITNGEPDSPAPPDIPDIPDTTRLTCSDNPCPSQHTCCSIRINSSCFTW